MANNFEISWQGKGRDYFSTWTYSNSLS